jgi:SH3-like domain-containing protein
MGGFFLMAKMVKTQRKLASFIVAMACIGVSSGVLWSVFGKNHSSEATAAEVIGDETTASISKASSELGPSGLPIPRFVSLKAEKVNVRKGPSSDHPVAWVFQSKGLPVEIIAEFETYRRIRDSDGTEGWILQNMLAGKRTAVVTPWRKDQMTALHVGAAASSSVIANLSSGAMGDIKSCDGNWCKITVNDYSGYVEQSMLWGAYPGEVVN